MSRPVDASGARLVASVLCAMGVSPTPVRLRGAIRGAGREVEPDDRELDAISADYTDLGEVTPTEEVPRYGWAPSLAPEEREQ